MNQWPDQDYWMAAEGVAYIEAVESDALQRFCFQFDRLKTIIRMEQLEDPWLSMMRVLSRVRMRMLAMPIPFDSESMGMGAVRVEIKAILKQVGSGDVNRTVVVSCLESLEELELWSHSNPLADRVVEILETGDSHSRGLVVLRPEWIAPTATWIRERVSDVGVWSRKDGNSIPIQQLLVLPGRPQYFARRDEDTVPFLTAPRSESTCFVQFDFLGLPKPVPGLLDSGSSSASRQIRGGFRVPEVIIDDSPEEPELFDWEAIRYRRSERGGTETDEFVPARAVTFADGSHTFVLASDEGIAQVATSDPMGKIKLISKPSAELDPGDVLIIRTGGSEAGHIRDLADHHFGVGLHRSTVDNWKIRVRRAVFLEGGPAAARRAMGEASGAARNFDHWISEGAIKPRERSDFDVVSRFAGLSPSDAEEVWDAMSKVFLAHIQAGQMIRDRLEERLEGRSLQSLEDAEYVEVEIAGFGTLRASRIIGIAPFSDTVPHRFIGVINPQEID
jgi:hypothetical protein